MNSQTALITGSSSGIGFHLAHEFALHGHPLVLVAPVEAELEKVARKLTVEHGVHVTVIAKDLEQENSAQEIFDELRRNAIDVHILVNNAGHGYRGKSWEIPIEQVAARRILSEGAQAKINQKFYEEVPRDEQKRERGDFEKEAATR